MILEADVFFFILGYVFFSMCLIAPPLDVRSAGFSIENIFSSYLGSQDLNFIHYQLCLTSLTKFIHSLLPLGFYISLGFFKPNFNLFSLQSLSTFWTGYLTCALALLVFVAFHIYFQKYNDWRGHPCVQSLQLFANNGQHWKDVAFSVNNEFMEVNKLTCGPVTSRVYITANWILKKSIYNIYVSNKNDASLEVTSSDEHFYQVDSEPDGPVQYLNISVTSRSRSQLIKPFMIRLNSYHFRDLEERINAPITLMRDIVINESLSQRFLLSFREYVNGNEKFHHNSHMDIEQCIGCMQVLANVKINKRCAQDSCGTCYCRPMWCLDCMGKWFASRQNQLHPEEWMAGSSPCPTCRSTFCLNDVLLIE